MQKRRNILAGLLSFAGLTAAKAATTEDQPEAVFNSGLQLFFAQRDAVVAFDGATGIGSHIGTVEGAIVGTSIVNFQFIPTSQNTIKFDNRTLITDIDGDQILFQYVGTGQFNPGLTDAALPALGSLLALGGPIKATYVALQANGKYQFLVGRRFPAKSIATNSIKGGGNVYLEVYSDSVAVLSSSINASR